MPPFVPDDFDPPTALDHPRFRLRPLGPEHNESDYAAWTSSMAHIHATPGYEDHPWPLPMPIEQNLDDLVGHADDFRARRGFTYTVLRPAPDETVIGCVYIYPPKAEGFDAHVRSWVRAADADLDPLLYRAVRDWLAETWPFERADYPARPEAEPADLGQVASELLVAATTPELERPAPEFAWTSGDLGAARVDLEDKEALRRALDQPA